MAAVTLKQTHSSKPNSSATPREHFHAVQKLTVTKAKGLTPAHELEAVKISEPSKQKKKKKTKK